MQVLHQQSGVDRSADDRVLLESVTDLAGMSNSPAAHGELGGKKP